MPEPSSHDEYYVASTSNFQKASIDRDHRRGIDYAAVRQQISISQVLREIGWEPVKASGTQIRGPCPVHKSSREKSRIFSVNTQRNIWKCFKCDDGGNQLDLYAAVTGLPIYQACLELCEKLGIEPPWMTE